MAGFLDQFRNKVVASVWKDEPGPTEQPRLNDRIALGVLLWAVAAADDRFLPEERAEIETVLEKTAGIPPEEISVVMESIRRAEADSIDYYHFTSEVSSGLVYPARVAIVDNLFRVACADGDLADSEHETIRKLAGLLGVDHKDFIDSKIRIKKEAGLDTTGL